MTKENCALEKVKNPQLAGVFLGFNTFSLSAFFFSMMIMVPT